MDVINRILSIAPQIYKMVERVKANKKRCRRVSDRVKALEELVKSIQQREAVRTSVEVEKALEELSITLESAQELIKKYTLVNWWMRFLKSSSYRDEFSSLNERLDDAIQILSGAQQVKHGDMLCNVHELVSRVKEDEAAGREDDKELQKLLLEYMKDQKKNTDAMGTQFEHLKVDVKNIVETLKTPRAASVHIKMIKADELKYGHPKQTIMTTSTSEVYKGEYCGFPVAIKRYIDPVNISPEEVRSVFNKEVDTMKQFESPNILRMYGICVMDENRSNPEFLIVMEYCEKGSLRHLLNDLDDHLSWYTKAYMCLDAAQGLYRLHQTEEKSKVHGCISSDKFFVAKDNIVKLGGFERSKTESSLKKQTKHKEISSLCYRSPEMFDVNQVYSKECEMYSFGIVLWEIATRRKPFEGYSKEEIYQKVCKEKYQEPLPDDCPEALGQLIKDCRAYDSFLRPSAGVLVDKLRIVVAQMEEKNDHL